MPRLLCFFAVLAASSSSLSWSQSAAVNATAERPIQALLVTGGCCHDYDRQKEILTQGISARANVQWTVVQQGGKTTDTKIPLYEDPDWAEGFDIVVHNECFANVKDLEFVDRILKPHRDGLPAVLIHCAMHCYRVGDNRWFDFVGLRSPGHGPHYAFDAVNLKPDHPIMEGFGESFHAAKGELYHAVEIFESATPLAQAKRKSDGEPQVCIWTNDYQGTRVFGTTIGHYNQTMAGREYLDFVTKGLLWATGRNPADHFQATDEATDRRILDLVSAAVHQPGDDPTGTCCGEGNLALGGQVTAKSFQTSNEPDHLTDGRLDTRWCASGAQSDEWVTVDLGKAAPLKALRLHWEKRQNCTYRYRIDGSTEGRQWRELVDASENKEAGGLRTHELDGQPLRYLRVTFLGSRGGGWGSLWELEATDTELADLPDLAQLENPPTTTKDVQVAEPFEVRIFGGPPEVNYPVCLTTAANGDVFVGVDEQGSLGKAPGGGRVLRCRDIDGDGTAEQITTFAEMDHPRGLVFDNHSLWVLHPPYLTVYHDTDGDGVADTEDRLIEGISTDQVNTRGADHTTNGIRLGIDGWIYIAVGDFGFTKAVAKDGTTLSRRGGGVVRIRPDGSDMEYYVWGLRNIMDVAIDPTMNMFTRGNTNDGGGWDVRLNAIHQTADYGYPSLYKNFTAEAMPPLADYGGGSGCGSMYLHDDRWPEPFNAILLTCDWGRSAVFSHRVQPVGAHFEVDQETFLKLPRPTDIDVDASGRLYVSSWKNGGFSFSGPDVGFVAQVMPAGFVPHPLPDPDNLEPTELIEALKHPSAAWRLTAQRALLRQTDIPVDQLTRLAMDHEQTIASRAAAVLTLGLLPPAHAQANLVELASQPALQPLVLRALTDAPRHAAVAPVELVLDALESTDPKTQAAAIIATGRMLAARDDRGNTAAASLVDDAARRLLPLTDIAISDSSTTADDWRKPHPERVLPHLAVKALVKIDAAQACLAAIEGPHADGAFWALRQLHTPEVVEGLLRQLSRSRSTPVRNPIWTTLIRLYHREASFEKGWWGTRPDTTGPYFDRATWDQSATIARTLQSALSTVPPSEAEHIARELKRHRVDLGNNPKAAVASADRKETPIELPPVDPENPDQIANLDDAAVLKRSLASAGDAGRGQQIFKAQACATCHSYVDGQQAKGPHLVDIGKRYKPAELIESIVKPNAKIAQGFDTWAFLMVDGTIQTGFVVLESAETVTIRQNDGTAKELLQDDIEERLKREQSMMPEGVVDNLTPEQLSDLIAYLQTLH